MARASWTAFPHGLRWVAATLVLAGGSFVGCGAPYLTFADDRSDATPSEMGAGGGPGASDGDASAAGSAGSEPADTGPLISPDGDPIPRKPRCKNDKKDGDETDVDCGGPTCPACGVGQVCASKDDCLSSICLNNTCRAPSCTDEVKNGDEIDVDCGGSSCAKCPIGKGCETGADCTSASCGTDKTCKVATCDDHIKNQDETDVDCGGATCPDCTAGMACTGGDDCQSGVCTSNACQPPSCTDGVANGNETGIDCGGPISACSKRCALGDGCKTTSDCTAGTCLSDLCQGSLCADLAKDGDETDVDCGGASCAPCAIDKTCIAANDCVSKVCSGSGTKTCQAPSCSDGVQNGVESAPDCGGTCAACDTGKTCRAANDCASRVCTNGVCIAASCTDIVKNGTETDVDCGGGCTSCTPGRKCSAAGDCDSGVCVTNVCQAPSCTDGVKNGDEAGVDCGPGCVPCSTGKPCLQPSDCASGVCSMNVCQAATCSDQVKNGGESDVDCGAVCPKQACGSGKSCGNDADCASANCSTGKCQYCPKSMVAVPISGGGTYCIDATEVTEAQYATWLQTNPSKTGQPSACSGNTSFAPATAGTGCSSSTYNPQSTPNLPVSCVDWCDAYAYCKAVGKRLCGKIGGGSNPTTGINDANASQWYRACSAGGLRSYPYGNGYSASACVGKDSVNSPSDVASSPSCVGGYPGIYDLSGNVSEWEDSCSTATPPSCQLRGGAYSSSGASLVCSVDRVRSVMQYGSDAGFRCCTD